MADGGMHPLLVAAELDAPKDIPSRLLLCLIFSFLRQLPLQGLEEGLGGRVVPWVAGP